MGAASPNLLIRKPLLTPERMEVKAEGELVALTIGTTTLKMHYSDALKISQWLRVRAKEAKHNAGDKSRSWSVVADLRGILPDGTLLPGGGRVGG